MSPHDGESPRAGAGPDVGAELAIPPGLRDCADEPISQEYARDALRMLEWTERYQPTARLDDMSIRWKRVIAALRDAGVIPPGSTPATAEVDAATQADEPDCPTAAAPTPLHDGVAPASVGQGESQFPDQAGEHDRDDDAPEIEADLTNEGPEPASPNATKPAAVGSVFGPVPVAPRTAASTKPGGPGGVASTAAAPRELSAVHREHLRTSGLTDETLALAGLYTERGPRELAEIIGRDYETRWGSAIVFPFVAPGSAKPHAFRVRPDKPRVARRKDGKPRPVKYDQAEKHGVLVYFPPRARAAGMFADAARPLIFTEGEKKSLLLDQLGYACVGLTGVWLWLPSRRDRRGAGDALHPLIAQHVAIAGREITIVFDADAAENPHVKLAKRRLADELYRSDARVVRFTCPPEGGPKGIDDYFVACGERATRALLNNAHVVRTTHASQPRLVTAADGDGGAGVGDAAEMPVDAPQPTTESGAGASWRELLSRKPKGQLLASAGNVELFMRNLPEWSGRLRYNARAGSITLVEGAPIADSAAPREFGDVDLTRVSIYLERLGALDKLVVGPHSDVLAGAIGAVARDRSFDPVKDYLRGLQWDNVERIDTFLSTYFGAADTPINRAYGRCWLISAVARTLTPGCQADHTLALVGPQGVGKSSALRCLAVQPGWFTDAVPDFGDKKRVGEILTGRWIVELGELDALKRSEVSAAKAALSTCEDRYRAAYARMTESHPRRCVFAITTNEGEFLRDSTGARRFWPVEVEAIDLGALARDRDQLWAEAVAAFDGGALWHLTDRSLIAMAQATQERRRVPDLWEDPVARYLAMLETCEDKTAARKSEESAPVRVTVEDVLFHAIGVKLDRCDQPAQNRVSRIMQLLGWVRRRRRDGPIRKTRGGKSVAALRWAYEHGLSAGSDEDEDEGDEPERGAP